ncbi:DUF397 domain-containing protein [Streptomyces nigrescens]|uniref:DUF397 domain-containing protein n=1 Tax=Streptomyces nigrescens TaxID=1920 RepID=A0ABY7IY34_STRNI|nr:DUF397 domain-containing protein [Streptomyces nigrescens]WAU03825.1 DUF397 domain-containing protein [Streptomyces nigrescens]
MQEFANGVRASSIPNVIWTKSRKTMEQGQCVETAALPGGGVAIRNSREPDGPALVYTRAEMVAFLDGVKGNEFDHLVV